MMTKWTGESFFLSDASFYIGHELELISSEGEPSMPTSASSLAPPPSSIPATPATAGEPPVQNIQMRSLIVTGDASVIIGRAGAHVNEIRVSSTISISFG